MSTAKNQTGLILSKNIFWKIPTANPLRETIHYYFVGQGERCWVSQKTIPNMQGVERGFRKELVFQARIFFVTLANFWIEVKSQWDFREPN